RLLKHFLLDPQWHCHLERSEAARRIGKVGLQQPLKFDQRLLEEDDVIDAIEVDLARLKAIADSMTREACIVFLAGKALLLRGSHNLSVQDKCRRAVMIKG